MGILNWATGGSTKRTGRFSLAGSWLPAGAVMTGLVLLAGAVPASAQTLAWSVVHSPNRRANGNYLDAVSCVSATMCMATGHRLNRIGAIVTLAERWDGTSWSLVRSPNAARIGDELVAVSCASASACMAVGFTQDGPGGTPGRVLERYPVVGGAHPQSRHHRPRSQRRVLRLAELLHGRGLVLQQSHLPDPDLGGHSRRVAHVTRGRCRVVAVGSTVRPRLA